MTATRVNIEAGAWTDLRFDVLAQLLRLPGGRDHALILCAKIWSWQTANYTPEQPTYVVDRALVDGVLGPGGADAMVGARLAERVESGLRIRGSADKIEWLYRLSQNGRRSKNKHKEVAPARAGAAAPAEHLPGPLSSLSLSSSSGYIHIERAREDELSPDVRIRAVSELMREVDSARAELGQQIGETANPCLAFDPGRHELMAQAMAARTVDDLDQLKTQARRAIRNAFLEGVRDRSLADLTGKVFSPRNMRRLAAMSEADAKRRRAGPSSSAERAPEPEQPRRLKTL